jgi:hypothetical protein
VRWKIIFGTGALLTVGFKGGRQGKRRKKG